MQCCGRQEAAAAPPLSFICVAKFIDEAEGRGRGALTDGVSRAARAQLISRGVKVSEVFHDADGVYAGTDEPYLFGRRRVGGLDPEHRSYRSFASFRDPDGNGWLLQEITARLPGRVDANDTTFTSSTELATALRRAAAAHGEHEKRTGQYDANWPVWYADYIVREQAGKQLPT